jgi:uncharacterized repeat protein (TIGR03943 family)
MRPEFRRWQGVALCAAALVSTSWLAITGQLILYIHPRYIVFTVVLTGIGLLLIVASLVSRRTADAEHDGHSHDGHADDGHLHVAEPAGRWRGVLSALGAALTFAVAVALVVVPPATLTTATADQRVINAGQAGSSTASVEEAESAAAGASAKFTVADWASLLRQTSDPTFYRDKPVDVTGFVTADPDDPENVFYVSRFVITCCAVDAQPVGVPVYQPGWDSAFDLDQWVRVTGTFDIDPSRSSAQPVAVLPESSEQVDQPSDPYLY